MPNIKVTNELDQIVELIAKNPHGISLNSITKTIDSTSRRTLQRRLATLVSQKRITTFGAGRTLKYLIPDATATLNGSPNDDKCETVGEVYVPLSAEAQEIKNYVKQPRQQRKPVSYKTNFLEQYHPNQTYYLPTNIREQLHSLGRSPAENTPAGTFARDILNRLLIDLSWASSQLEGNTYSQLDTERLIEFGQAAEGKDAMETQMILNHKAAIEYLVMNIDQTEVAKETIISLHAFLSDGLMADPLMS